MSREATATSGSITSAFEQGALEMTRFGTLILGAAMVSLTLATPASAQDWWKVGDREFAARYAGQALSNDVTEQSIMAWMLFARVNQQVPLGRRTVAQWEMWPSNADTFSGAVAFTAANKIRTRPHLQTSKAARSVPHFKNTPTSGGEEVTRNLISYGYIVGNGLNTQGGVFNYLGTGKPVQLPNGATEVKAFWDRSAIPGAYQFHDATQNVTYSLLGLHIMSKFTRTPADPFHSEDPSWFWTTFEFKGNPGLANAQSLLTYKDRLSVAQATALLTEAELGKTNFVNYRSNGTQIRYSDKANPKILLGNTEMEAFASVPPNSPPSQWTAWNTSCHTCHGTTSARKSGSAVQFYPFTVPTGKIRDPAINNFTSMDFIWSIAFQAQ